jgi:hypothetical protein
MTRIDREAPSCNPEIDVQGPFLDTEMFVTICARLVGVAVEQLPASIVVQLP